MLIRPKENAKDLWDINEGLAIEALLYRKDNELPLPWDADISIEGDKVTLEGSIFGGSANLYNNAGYCKCEISVAKFSNAYELEIPDSYVRDHMSPEDLQSLWDAGWERA